MVTNLTLVQLVGEGPNCNLATDTEHDYSLPFALLLS
jgi:hypothetical protein